MKQSEFATLSALGAEPGCATRSTRFGDELWESVYVSNGIGLKAKRSASAGCECECESRRM